MIEPNHKLSVTRQAKALAISRGSVYYQSRPLSDQNLFLMRLIDKLHLDHPFAGSRMLRDLLYLRGIRVGRRHIGTLMRKMGIHALYAKLNTSARHPGHRTYPYLLRYMSIDRPNQVWAMDITYIPMARGFIYLAVVIDWYAPKALSWRASNMPNRALCLQTTQVSIDHYDTPVISNFSQSRRLTPLAWVRLFHFIIAFLQSLLVIMEKSTYHCPVAVQSAGSTSCYQGQRGIPQSLRVCLTIHGLNKTMFRVL